ncbi:MAG TPA: TatD family hydrolase [bacterium]|nr:TatD family hydrolase [bacterium]
METLFDTHAHLDFKDFDRDREDVIARARAAGVKYMVTIGSGDGIEASARALEIARRHEDIWATVGVHPHDAKLIKGDPDLAKLHELAQQDKVVAIGEIGLDYAKEYSPRHVQLARLRDQLRLARDLDLPVVIHDRDAHDDLMRVLKEDGVPKPGSVMHCFSGSAALALELVRLGFYISFPGVITFKNARAMAEAAARVPEDRILIETDCPFLAPEPHRGKRNEPAYVRLVAEAVAKIRGIPLPRLAELTTGNAFRAFAING